MIPSVIPLPWGFQTFHCPCFQPRSPSCCLPILGSNTTRYRADLSGVKGSWHMEPECVQMTLLLESEWSHLGASRLVVRVSSLPLAFRFFRAVNLKTCQAHTNWITALQWALFSLLMFPSSECYRAFRWGVDAGVDHMSLYSHRHSRCLSPSL